MANEVRINVTSRDRSGPGFQSARRNADQLGESTRRIGDIAAGIIASQVFERIASSAVRAFTSTIRAASDLEQAVGGTEAVFGDASGAIDAFAQRSADAAGLSEAEFRNMTTLVGGQLKRMTGDVNLAADASVQLAVIAADLAATYGGTTKQAMDAFAAALRGEADPAERFNLNLKASVVNAKAVEMGLAATTTEVDENARAQAILALIMEQSADAQGQFAREGDTLAVAQQKLAANVEDLQASMGEKLLPVMAAATDFATDLVAGFANLPGPIQSIVGVVGGLTVALGAAATAARVLNVSLLAIASNPIVITASAIVGVAAITLAQFGDSARNAAVDVEGLRATLDRTTGAITDSTREWVANRLVTEGLADDARRLGIDLNVLTDAYLGDAEALRVVNDHLAAARGEVGLMELATFGLSHTLDDGEQSRRRLINDLDEQVPLLQEAQEKQRDYAAAAEDTTAEVETLEERQARLNQELKTAEENLRAAEQAVSDYANEVRSAFDPVEKIRKAEEDLIEAQERVNTLQSEGKTDTAEYEDALWDLVSAQSGVDAAHLDFALGGGATALQQLKRLHEQGKIDQDTYDRLTAEIEDTTEAAEDSVGEYEIEAEAKGWEAAKRKADEARRAAEAAEGIYTMSVNTFRTTYYNTVGRAPGGHFAHGGIVGAPVDGTAQGGGPRGNRVLVGEHQPEVVELPIGSRVIPSVDQAMDRGQAAGAGAPVVIELHSGGTRLDDLLLEVLRQSIRVRGGNVQTVLGRS